ncbi:MAG: alpha/beta fold hydrolase [Deltaproteobacteria bacterium]|nr:alpha/beta fold hydrolase [Deltaproteobacteria bacterium]
MSLKHHTIEARGFKVHYVEWGSPKGIPLILVHGFLDHARSWDPFVAAIEKITKRSPWIIAPDCRGHGDSGWVGSGGYYHFPDYVLDLDALISSLKVSSVVLMGHSMGGTISFLYSGTFPARVKKLVLVEGVGPPGFSFSHAPERMGKWIAEINASEQKRPVEYGSVEQMAERLRQRDPRLNQKVALHVARYGSKVTPTGKRVWKFDPLHRTSSPQPFYAGQALEFLRRIQCPVLLVRGKESRQVHRKDLGERFDAIPRSKLVEIPRAGHMVHRNNPDALARAVAAFVKSSKA